MNPLGHIVSLINSMVIVEEVENLTLLEVTLEICRTRHLKVCNIYPNIVDTLTQNDLDC